MWLQKKEIEGVKMKKDINHFRELIIEALEDYKRWFDDVTMTLSDKEKVKSIDEAIEFVNGWDE